jgi:hypothetical protein
MFLLLTQVGATDWNQQMSRQPFGLLSNLVWPVVLAWMLGSQAMDYSPDPHN